MKKFLQFILRLLAAFGFVAGLYYLYKKYFATEIPEDDFDFDEEADDFDFDEEDFTETVSDAREYVTLNASERKSTDDEEPITESITD